ncbi:ESPR-type extended signal peptide-containing protein, partial [Haemophilus sp. SZY H54]
MNKVFKIIWNKTTQSLVVTSELAKGEAKASSSSSSKNSTTGKFFKLSVLALFFSQICDVAYAAVTAGNRDTAVRTDDRGAIAIAGGTAGDPKSTSLDQGNGPIAIGWGVKAVKNGDIAIGGKDNLATSVNGGNAIGFGVKTLVTASKGVAIGSDAQVLANSGLALGEGAVVTAGNDQAHSIALGSGSYSLSTSTSNLDITYKNKDGQDVTAVSAGKNNIGTLSIGNAGSGGKTPFTRQIVNVGAGEIAESSTDAVNGSQLYHVLTKSGFNVKQAGTDTSRITNNKNVNFVNGAYTTASVASTASGADVTFNVKTQDITVSKGRASEAIDDDVVARAKNVAKAINTVADSKADKETEYQFRVAGKAAKTWNLGTGNRINFAVENTGDLEVEYINDENGSVQYGLSQKTKSNISNALTTAQQASTSASSATTVANNALNVSQTASTVASSAQNTANLGLTTARTASNSASAAYQVATGARDTANAASSAISALHQRQYKFNIANNVNKLKNDKGEAVGWDLKNDGGVTFGATDDLEVSTDKMGNIVYGWSQTSKNTISSAVSNAVGAANSAKSSASAASNSASSAQSSASVASNSASSADSSASAASNSASAADSSASAASNSASAADSSASAASNSASAADSSAS